MSRRVLATDRGFVTLEPVFRFDNSSGDATLGSINDDYRKLDSKTPQSHCVGGFVDLPPTGGGDGCERVTESENMVFGVRNRTGRGNWREEEHWRNIRALSGEAAGPTAFGDLVRDPVYLPLLLSWAGGALRNTRTPPYRSQ